MAAGINEVDASHVANELQDANSPSERTIVDGNGNDGPDGKILANGQGRTSQDANREGMYGTGFRGDSMSSGTEKTATDDRPPASAIGRYSYLGKAGRQTSSGNVSSTDSPAIASHADVHAAHNAPDEALGGMVGNEQRQKFARTASSGV